VKLRPKIEALVLRPSMTESVWIKLKHQEFILWLTSPIFLTEIPTESFSFLTLQNNKLF